MLRVAICDDEPVILRELTTRVQSAFSAAEMPCSVHSYTSGTQVLDAYQKQPFDILFLDICMPDCDGFFVARQIRARSEQPFVLFVTSNDELVFDSFDYRPFQFVRKGNASQLAQSLEAAIAKLVAHCRESARLELDLGLGENRVISVREILYVKSDRHYMDYYLDNGAPVHVRQSMEAAQKLLPTQSFLLIHRKYLVHLPAIQSVDLPNSELMLQNGVCLPIARSCKAAIADAYRLFLRAQP